MKLKIKEIENKDRIFSLVENEGDIHVEVNGKVVVQFMNCTNHIDMWTNFLKEYKELDIKKL